MISNSIIRVFSTIFLLATPTLSTPTTLPNSNSLYNCLQSNGLIPIIASSFNYREEIAAYNQRLQPLPFSIITPTTIEEVSSAVSCASQFGFTVSAKSGGHSYASYGFGEDNGLVIDLSSLKSIQVNSDSNTAQFGSGVRLGDLALALNEQGRAMPHGTCPFVGVGGHLSFGGFGLSSRMWGLSLDNIVGVDVVLANGTIIKGLNEKIDADLFWALKGAGPNFGIITQFYVRTYPIPSTAINFAYSWSYLSVEDSTTTFLAFQEFGRSNSPATLGISIVLGKGGSVEINGVSYSTLEEFEVLLKPLLDQVTGGYSSNTRTFTWIQSLGDLAGNQSLNTTGVKDNRDDFFAKSLTTPMASPLTSEALTAYFTYLHNTETDTNWFVECNLYGGANSKINSIPLSENAFAHRESLLNFQMYASSSSYGPPYSSTGIEFVAGMYNSIVNPMLSIWGENYGAYVNYVDPTLVFVQVIAFYWGKQYERLSHLRGIYDLQSTFKNPQSIRQTGVSNYP